MKILILGVSGFIGRELYAELCAQGHQVVGCSRKVVPNIRWRHFDFRQDSVHWENLIADMDLVINTIGIYEETNTQSFSLIHTDGPIRFFYVCKKFNKKVIQISAIGAEKKKPVTEFLRSKHQADQFLLNNNIPCVVLYPGIVLGEGGRSTQQLSILARLWIIPSVFKRQQGLPLTSVAQLRDEVINIVNQWPGDNRRQIVFTQVEPIEKLFSALRFWMGLSQPLMVYIPNWLTRSVFHLFPHFSIGAFNKDSLAMLTSFSQQHFSNTLGESATASLVKKKPSVDFVKAIKEKQLYYLNVAILSFIWIMSGISSLIAFDISRDLMAELGQRGEAADFIIVTAALGDIFLGLAIWFTQVRDKVLFVQIGVIAIYSLIITLTMPEYWLHPFAPVIKNLAMLMLIFYLLKEKKNV